MAHFAEIDESNIVVRVVVVSNEDIADGRFASGESEEKGISFLQDLLGADTNWVQTSFNTHGNVHDLGGTPLRGNYAGDGFTYDSDLDVFYSPSPHPSWVLDENHIWQAPVTYVEGHLWDEDTTSWVKPDSPYPSWSWSDENAEWTPPTLPPEDESEENRYDWDEDTTSWVAA